MGDIGRNLVRSAATAVLVAAMPLAIAQEPAQAPAEEPQAGHAQGDATDEAAERSRVEALREITAERRDEALASARRAADDLDRQMERLQQQMDEGWDRMSQATRTRSRSTMADLRQRRNALAEWLGGMRHGSNAAWTEVRGGFVKSYQELAEAMRKARTEFARPPAEPAPPEPDLQPQPVPEPEPER